MIIAKRMFFILSSILGLSWFSLAFAIEELNVDPQSTCNYYGELAIQTKLYGFESDAEAEEIIKNILRYSGLEPNFRITAANVPNAAAVLKPNTHEGVDRLILYSQDFMERVKQRTNTDWSAISILAHEIGHHLQGHTLQPGGSRPSIELEADKYSGYIVAMLGGSLDDAQSAIRLISSETGSATHPPRSARLAAITNGWKQAISQIRRVQGKAEDFRQPAPSPIEPPPTKTDNESYLLAYGHVSGPSFRCSAATKPIESLICRDPILRKADGIMGAMYRDLRRELNPPAADRVRVAQHQWIKDRDRACPVSHRDLASSSQSEIVATCLLIQIQARSNELWRALSGAEPQ